MEYELLGDDEPMIVDNHETIKIACCDCCLVHNITVSIKRKKIKLTFDRNNRATGQLRRHKQGGLFEGDDKHKIVRR